MSSSAPGHIAISSLPPPPVFGLIGSHGNTLSNVIGGKHPPKASMSLDDIFDDFLLEKAQSNIGGEKNSNTFEEDDSMDDDDDYDEDSHKKKRHRGLNRNMTEEQKIERRERNREHAKRSRVRKKFLLESLQQSVRALQEENDELKSAIRENLTENAEELLAGCTSGGPSIIASDPNEATKTLDDPDYRLVKALQTAQQNFVISDPCLPDNPIVYASAGFLTLTGYSLDQVLGRNCRFLQGPDTDPSAVDRIRRGIEKGEDTTVVLLNYRIDRSTFWNQLFIAPLRDGEGNVVNYLGVQCKVSEEYARAFEKSEAEL